MVKETLLKHVDVTPYLTHGFNYCIGDYLQDTYSHDASGENRLRGLDAMNYIEQLFFSIGQRIGLSIRDTMSNKSPVIVGLSEGGWSVAEGLGNALSAPILHTNTGRNHDYNSPVFSSSQVNIIQRSDTAILAEDMIRYGRTLSFVRRNIQIHNPNIDLCGVAMYANNISSMALEIPIYAAHFATQDPNSYLREILG